MQIHIVDSNINSAIIRGWQLLSITPVLVNSQKYYVVSRGSLPDEPPTDYNYLGIVPIDGGPPLSWPEAT
jgi:hypothetical protein